MAASLGIVLAIAAAIVLVACGDDGNGPATEAGEGSEGGRDAVEPGRFERPMVIQGGGRARDVNPGDSVRIEISLEAPTPGASTDMEPEGEEITGRDHLAYLEDDLVTWMRVTVGDQSFQTSPAYMHTDPVDPRTGGDGDLEREVAIDLAKAMLARL